MPTTRLSRGFSTHKYENPMPRIEENLKSPIALVVGILPYIISSISLSIFKNFAALASSMDEYGTSSTNWLAKLAARSVQVIASGIGMSSGVIMVLSAKVFALSQKLVWGGYVEKPMNDGQNTRLAWYGANEISTKDLLDIPLCFIRQSNEAWGLKEWAEIVI